MIVVSYLLNSIVWQLIIFFNSRHVQQIIEISSTARFQMIGIIFKGQLCHW